jgi:Fe-S-cluster-containing hydrogenase component 2
MSPVNGSFDVVVDETLCHECAACVGICPFGALQMTESRLVVNNDRCTDCQWCLKICPFHALRAQPLRQAVV